jgi:hypothetical protein
MKRSFILGAILTTLAYAVVVSTASATKPTREYLPAADTVLNGYCAFPVSVEIVKNQEYALTRSDGTTIVTGRFVVRLTNLVSGVSKTVNASGPAKFVSTADSFTIYGKGRGLIFLTAEELGTSNSVLLLVTGPAVIRFTSIGVSFTHTGGTTTDLCRLLG